MGVLGGLLMGILGWGRRKVGVRLRLRGWLVRWWWACIDVLRLRRFLVRKLRGRFVVFG